MIPDIEQARRFLRVLDPGADSRDLLDGFPNGFTFQTFDDSKTRKDRKLARIFNATLDDCWSRLARLSKDGAGVFVTINETDMQGRRKENIIRQRAVWAELDNGDIVEFPIEPHLVTETSPGKFHKIFLVDGLTPEEHLAVETALIQKYGSDPDAKDISRVLRVPGFPHQKDTPHMVRLIHESGRKPYTKEEIFNAFRPTENLPAVRNKRTIQGTAEAHSNDGYSALSESDAQLPLPDITLENCEKYLPEPGEQTRGEWFEVLKAFHHQFNGAYEALEIFDRWSQQVRAYNGFDDIEATWNSLNRGYPGAVTTFKVLVQAYNKKLAKGASAKGASAYAKAQQLLESCTDHIELTGIIAPKLWALANGVVSIEKDFCQALINRYAEIRGGEQLTRQEATRALKSKRKSAEEDEHPLGYRNPHAPDWSADWVWISTDEQFFNTETGVCLTSKGFSGHYDSRLPKGEGAPVSASAYARDNYFVPKVMKSFYLPGADTIFIHDGVSCVNTYSERYRAVVPDEIDHPEAVKIFKRHIEYICGGWNREAQLFCNFLKTCVDSPPRKMRWATVLIGVQGDGKSLFRSFFARALGLNNVRSIKGTTIAKSAETSFSGWVEGHCLGFIEEIKLHGHNRFDVINSIKDVITENVIEMHKKGFDPRNTHNAANYMLTTNYLDAIPIEIGDRRYFLLLSKFALEDILKKEPDYFTKLAGAINDYTGDLVCWLRTIPLHPDFDPDKPAPMTDTKRAAITMTADTLDEIVQEIIRYDDDPLCQANVVCFNQMFSKVLIKMEGALKNDQQYKLAKALVNLGYVKLKRCSVAGERHTLWVKRIDGEIISLEAAREIIESKLSGDLVC